MDHDRSRLRDTTCDAACAIYGCVSALASINQSISMLISQVLAS